jgi:glycosyltransferase involved in cell wall biosynthesis
VQSFQFDVRLCLNKNNQIVATRFFDISASGCQTMKLSVIIPAYNRAQMIGDTIDSILSSGLEGFEIVVVDDGSTDRTHAVVSAMGFPVQYIRQANGGLASARNTGFAVSRGRYVAFLDSDDQWYPGAVRTLVEHLDAHEDIPFIFGDAQMGSPSTGFVSFVETFGGEAFRNLPSREIEPTVRCFDRGPFFHQLVRRNVVFLGAVVMRREVVNQVGPFDAFPYGAEDWHFFLRLALRYDFSYCEGLAVAAYLQHSSNMTKDGDRMQLGFCRALRLLLQEPGLGTEERTHVLNHMNQSKFCYAYPAYDRGDFHAASERFLDCLRSEFTWKSLFYWLACQLPSPFLARARRLKRRFSTEGESPTRSGEKAWQSSP